MKKLNPEIKKKWVKALRSGKYNQCDGQLRQGDTFCCLGVLCDLHRKAMKKGDNEWKKITWGRAIILEQIVFSLLMFKSGLDWKKMILE